MRSPAANGSSRRSFWPRVREFAVPPSMIETATARRAVGDWAGACAAAGVDTDLDLRSVARSHGLDLAARVRRDLRHLAPDLLRWHMPRTAPDGLLRPGLTAALARYDPEGGGEPVLLVVRTPPARADAGQRMSLALWSRRGADAVAHRHPHPHPDQRFRLDLHRHLWDARRTGELPSRSGADLLSHLPSDLPPGDPDPYRLLPPDHGCAVGRWAAEAALLLHTDGRRADGAVAVRLGARHRLVAHLLPPPGGNGPPTVRLSAPPDGGRGLPVLPDAATWVLPDLELLRAGLVDADRLHPLVAAALAPGHRSAPPVAGGSATGNAEPAPGGRPRMVECRGAMHRIALVDGVLAPLDHGPDEVRREELLTALTGTPLPCLRAIDEAHRHPERLPDVRALLDHGDIARALAVVEDLLGPQARLRAGTLRDELEAAALRRIDHGLFRAGLDDPARCPPKGQLTARQGRRFRPRLATRST